MQTYVTLLLNKHKKSSTAVLFVSFLITFCVYPYADEAGIDGAIGSSFMNTPNGYSRTLLSVDVNSSILKDGDPASGNSAYDYIWNYYKSRYDI